MNANSPGSNHAHLTIQAAAAQLDSFGGRSVGLFRHGSLQVKYYAPRGRDPQAPHAQDEIYVIALGHGIFLAGAEEHAFAPGDTLFVAAGVAHCFASFTDDFATWVFFYGPEGGELHQP